ncbi:putative G-protein coupled receptor F59B2.13 [Mercenaria mercenaria]|uniref:putative G-protein coupled receptor F59B2.13 n=1 Tax=Mercenaria mercenaria TaxID=6596 RepID=UPI00234F2636|nr:putative G-protein coupled receptor F59B2.13 [Mercenaria mercenaria]
MNTSGTTLFENFTTENVTFRNNLSSSIANRTTLSTTTTTSDISPPIDDILSVYWEYNTAYNLGLYGFPVLIILGTIGNILSLVVMLRENMRRRTTCFYMSMVAIFDTLVLNFSCLLQWLEYIQGQDVIWLRSSAACKISFFFSYTFFHTSVWLLVITTVERFLVVLFPLQAFKITSIARARITVLALIVVTIVVNSHFFWTLYLNEIKLCTYLEVFEHFHKNIWPWIDITVYLFLPFLLLLIFNVLIIIIHRRSIKRRAKLQIGKPRTRSSNQGRQLQLTATLLMVTFTFLFLSTPSVILIGIKQYFEVVDLRDTAIYQLLSTVTMFCLYVSHAVNCLLYCIGGQMFRSELWKILTCKCVLARAGSSVLSDFTMRTTRLSEPSVPGSPGLARRETENYF